MDVPLVETNLEVFMEDIISPRRYAVFVGIFLLSAVVGAIAARLNDSEMGTFFMVGALVFLSLTLILTPILNFIDRLEKHLGMRE